MSNPIFARPMTVSGQRVSLGWEIFSRAEATHPEGAKETLLRKIFVRPGSDSEAAALAVYEDVANPIEEPGPTRENWRMFAEMPRKAFCLELAKLGVLSEQDMSVAISGQWPNAFNDFIASMPLEERLQLRADWGDPEARRIRRNHPMIEPLGAAATPPMTPEDIDTLFGWSEPNPV